MRSSFAFGLAGSLAVLATAAAPPSRPPTRPAAPAQGAPAARPTPPARPADGATRPGGTPVEERVEGLRPRRVPPKVGFEGGPGIWFSLLDHDFGPMSNAETLRAKFEFENVGDQPLTVIDVVPACACTKPIFTKGQVVPPGERGVIEVDFTPPAGGHQAKSLTVMTDAKNVNDVVRIRVIGEVEAVLTYEPRSFEAGEVKMGKPWEGTLELVADSPESLFDEIVVSPRAAHLSASFVEPAPRKGRATVKVVIDEKAPWGLFRTGIAEIATRGKLDNGQEITKRLPFRVLATIVDDIRASDYVVQFGNVQFDEEFRGETLISSVDGRSFEIVEPRVIPMDQTARGVGEATYRVDVVRSDDPAAPGFKIVVSGKSGRRHGFMSGNIEFGTRFAGDEAVTTRSLGMNGYVVEPGGRSPLQTPRKR